MKTGYTAVIKQENDWWIGWIEEVPGVNCQERTREELVETLRLTLREALEFNRQEALAAADADFQKEKCRMNRKDFLRHLRSHGCEMLREGSRHS
jgi:predicted RNase H-like HicB family nuclease